MSLPAKHKQREDRVQSSGDNHDEISDTNDDRPSNSVFIYACQSCRSRKVRCDRKDTLTPCTACKRKGIECVSSAVASVRERRRKVLVTHSYEDKIDQLSRKLDKVFDAVHGQGLRPLQNRRSEAGTDFATIRMADSAATSQQTVAESSSDQEEEQHLNSEVGFAKNYAQGALFSGVTSPETNVGLHSLGRIIDGQHTCTPSTLSQKMLAPGDDLHNIKMPPLELVLSCIQELRTSESAKFFWTWDIDTMGQLLENVTAVYTGKASIAELIIVNSTLPRLLSICTGDGDASSASHQLYAKQCRKNLNDILSKLPFNQTPNFNNVLALYHAAIDAMERGKTLTAWNYIAGSVQMCHALGYFRERAHAPEQLQQTRRRKRLAWMILIIDKSLSLRTGRPSAVRESDFTLAKLTDASQDDVLAIGPSAVLDKWIDFSLLQGKIYDELYSPVALLQPEQTRIMRAQALATELGRVTDTIQPDEEQFYRDRSLALGADMHQLLCGADRINILATIALIYRVIPSTSRSSAAFCDECVDAAHEALDEHRRCLGILQNAKGSVMALYIQWAFLSSPFIPFVVLFCQVFETGEPAHLEKLASIVDMLQLMPDNLSNACGRQLRVFQLMYKVAHSYVQANQNTRAAGPMAYDTGFNMVFQGAANGMVSYDFGEEAQQLAWDNRDELMLVDPGTEIGHWFDQSQKLQSLAEDTYGN